MRKFITHGGFLVFLFASCSKDGPIPLTTQDLLILKVDYLTGQFEGASKQKILVSERASDTIPIRIDYKSPSDFGYISLYHKPTNQLLFNGYMIWMGKGAISFPKQFKPYNRVFEKAISQPEPDRFQILFSNPFYGQPTDYGFLWNAIGKLQIVEEYLKSNKKIGVFLYTPSVGTGNPADWDWILFMVK